MEEGKKNNPKYYESGMTFGREEGVLCVLVVYMWYMWHMWYIWYMWYMWHMWHMWYMWVCFSICGSSGVCCVMSELCDTE
ncbi:hypothetical protein Hamer_G024013 [Homarus americanus]|uniref:Transmembrane protein n=1 Tax=Homarus americanus TaxID=6706 RepID=A0A8J5KN07_HOMAM|nr:hypothetical protein Hamer_G024013 [Homarus americanus]